MILHRSFIVLSVLALVLPGCRTEFEPVEIQEYLGDYELICHPASNAAIRIAGDGEPGERLFLVGQVVDGQTKQPVPGARLFFYQANHEGLYDSRLLGMPSFARLSGRMRTDANGCFMLQTIIPGNYPDQFSGKHIHVRIKATAYRTWHMEFLFEGWLEEALRQEYLDRGDGVILNPVETLLPGIFLAECTLELRD